MVIYSCMCACAKREVYMYGNNSNFHHLYSYKLHHVERYLEWNTMYKMCNIGYECN